MFGPKARKLILLLDIPRRLWSLQVKDSVVKMMLKNKRMNNFLENKYLIIYDFFCFSNIVTEIIDLI